MQYIFVNDFNQIFRTKCKYFLAYFIIIIIILFYEILLQLNSHEMFLSLMGIKIINNNIIFLLVYLLNICISLFIAFNIFFNDFKNSICNIFSRVMPNRWIIYKIISCLACTFLFRIFMFFFILVLCSLLKKNISSVFYIVFLKNFFYYFFLQLIFVSLICLFQSDNNILLSIFVVMVYLTFANILIFSFDMWHIYIYLDILLTLFMTVLYKMCYIKLFERNGK